jgi:hypothetical protein
VTLPPWLRSLGGPTVAAWIQAGAAVGGLIMLVWLSRQTNRLMLLQAQVEPQLDAFPVMYTDPERPALVLQNSGNEPIVDITVDSTIAVLCGSRTVMVAPAGPLVPGSNAPRLWTLPRLQPSEVRAHPLSDELGRALKDAELNRPAARCDETKNPILPVVLLRVTYYRDVDHRRFTKLERLIPVGPTRAGGAPSFVEPAFLPDEERIAIERLQVR